MQALMNAPRMRSNSATNTECSVVKKGRRNNGLQIPYYLRGSHELWRQTARERPKPRHNAEGQSGAFSEKPGAMGRFWARLKPEKQFALGLMAGQRGFELSVCSSWPVRRRSQCGE